jgi:uncharacterized protein
MVVLIDQIREDGLQLDEPLSLQLLSEALGEPADTGFRVLGGSRLSAFLEKVSGGVLLRGKFEAAAMGPCKRCLKDVELSIPVSFILSLVPGEKRKGTEESPKGQAAELAGSFRLEDADHEMFDGKRIDLDPIVREQTLLALPMYVLCDEDCKGLCPICGQNLNESKCRCEVKPVDPRLSVLKNIKLN